MKPSMRHASDFDDAVLRIVFGQELDEHLTDFLASNLAGECPLACQIRWREYLVKYLYERGPIPREHPSMSLKAEGTRMRRIGIAACRPRFLKGCTGQRTSTIFVLPAGASPFLALSLDPVWRAYRNDVYGSYEVRFASQAERLHAQEFFEGYPFFDFLCPKPR